MKILRYIILLILLGTSLCFADAGVIGEADRVASVEAECTPPTGDEFSEDYLSTASDCTGGSNSYTAVTEMPDCSVAAPGTPPENTVCGYSMQANATGSTVANYWARGSAISDGTETDIEFYLYYGSGGNQTRYSSVYIVSWTGASQSMTTTSNQFKLGLYRGTADPDYDANRIIVAGSSTIYYDISIETWYHVKVHLDPTAANSYLSIDGDEDCAGGGGDTSDCIKFTRNTTAGQWLYQGVTGSTENVYIGNMTINTP